MSWEIKILASFLSRCIFFNRLTICAAPIRPTPIPVHRRRERPDLRSTLWQFRHAVSVRPKIRADTCRKLLTTIPQVQASPIPFPGIPASCPESAALLLKISRWSPSDQGTVRVLKYDLHFLPVFSEFALRITVISSPSR